MMRGYLKVLVLKAINENFNTGYCITKYIEEQTGKKPSYGSIYPLLSQLKKDELINSKKEGRKNMLSLTEKGKKELKRSHEQKKELVSKMNETMKLFEMITQKKSGHDSKLMEKFLEKGLPIHMAAPEVEKTKDLVIQILLDNPTTKQLKKLKIEANKYNQELKAIKRMKK